MAEYRAGDTVTNIFHLRNAAGTKTNADAPPTGQLYVAGVLNGATVTISSIATGEYRVSYVVPGSLADRAELTCLVQGAIGGVGWTKPFEDQHVNPAADHATLVDLIWDEVMSTHTTIGTAGAIIQNVGTTTISTGDAEMIAYYMLRADMGDVASSTLTGLPNINANSVYWLTKHIAPESHWWTELVCMARSSGGCSCGSNYCSCR